MNNILKFSEQESQILGLKIARSGRLKMLDSDALKNEILREKYDVIKLKLAATDERCFIKMASLGFPFHLMTILVRSRGEISEKDVFDESKSRLRFEKYDGKKENLLKELVEKSVAKPTATNFINPHLEKIVTPGMIAKASGEFVAACRETSQTDYWCRLAKADGNYVGFWMGKKNDDAFEGILYGVVPEFRGKGFGKEMVRHIKSECLKAGIKYFENDVVLQNFPSLFGILNTGNLPVETYLHFEITPLLTYNS